MTNKIMIHKKRRSSLLNQLGDDALVIVSTNPVQNRSNDTDYPYRPNSDFYYLTGFTEPDSVAVFSKDCYTIFLRQSDKNKEIWDGRRLGVVDAPNKLHANKSFSIESLESELSRLLSNKNNIFFDPKSYRIDNIIIESLNLYEFNSAANYIHEMRLIKDDNEVELMQKAANISIQAHEIAMKSVKPDMFEYEIQSIFDAQFTKNNSKHAYSPIVAGGENACILHYIENNKMLNKDSLILIDAGCEFEYYASDITRTFPICGSFSSPQKEVYQIVLDAQNAAINCIKPGIKVSMPHTIASNIIKEGLIHLGILKAQGELSEFYMHRTGHWIGIDVHDVGTYTNNGEDRVFESGMVITVEPGIYINNNDKINPMYRNIGIRIEDDVLVTNNGNKVLTGSLVKEIKDIESMMNN
jgi:Xaa-Pro aminopeptidase